MSKMLIALIIVFFQDNILFWWGKVVNISDQFRPVNATIPYRPIILHN